MRLPWRVAILAVLPVIAGWTQDQPPAAPAPPPIENNGKPMVVPFRCSMEDIEWAGLSCSEEEPCPIYLELGAIESVGSRIFAAGNIHSAAVTLYSALLSSEDAGKTWREPFERIRGSGLDHIQFLDPDTGWIGGQLLFPLAQDPFLLLTSDGGKSWRKRPVAGDSHYGSIQQFFFTAKNSGSLVIDKGPGSDGDRYELYESPDAGETWIIKEESTKPIRLKRAPVPSTEWRVRADGPSQAFHIEHRQGERWTRVASFAVKLSPCKPPQEAEKDPK